MTAKAEILRVISEMPDNATYEEIARQVEFIANVRKGLQQAKRCEGTPVEEILQQIPKWISQPSSSREGCK